MSAPHLSRQLLREVPLLRSDQRLDSAAQAVIDAGLPALPVVDSAGRYAGIFGEREFIAALFPGYLGQLRYAAFVPDALDDALERHSQCAAEPVERHMNTEHIDASPRCSDAQLVETFLHHRVLIVPIVDAGEVTGVVTRWDFFRAVTERLAS
jgi:CBS domain-containing protein